MILQDIAFAQSLSNIIKKKIPIESDTIQIDSFSVVPGTLKLFYGQTLISDTLYTVDYERSIVFITTNFQDMKGKELSAEYRRFGFNFYRAKFHKSPILLTDSFKRKYPVKYYSDEKEETFFSSNQLNKSGSISRGISIGNNRDASVTSDFNLQITGNISRDISISGNISDNNIPIQADGTSQHLREFDKVFIELKSKKSRLIAGDFEILSTLPYFVKYKKNVKGLGFQTEFDKKPGFNITSSLNMTLSKGKFRKLQIQGIEANQGPYKLTGNENEMFIVVISGSEKIYIDGVLLQRGADNDYVIDYNSAEITFTVKQIITKDSRITAEYEYTEQSYARFAVSTEHILNTKKYQLFFNYFNEYDAKNQNLKQDLTDNQKVLLNTIGDDLNSAIVPNVAINENSVDNQIFYRKTDSLFNNIIYPDVYVFTNDTSETSYILGFSFVGENSGNYIQIQTGINGRVYQWVAPVNEIQQGNYEPVRQLISPQKKQVITFGGKTHVKRNTNINFEISISDNDLNMFSNKNDKDNMGFAYKTGIEKNLLNADSGKTLLNVGLDYLFVNKNFNASEPFRSPEFERDWNLFLQKKTFTEHLLNFTSTYKKKDILTLSLNSELLNRIEYFSGFKNVLSVNFKKNGYTFNGSCSLLYSKDTLQRGNFIKYGAKLEKIFSWFSIGLSNFGERNILNNININIPKVNSFRFNQFETFATTREDKIMSLKFSYIHREDFAPKSEKMVYVSQSHDFKLSGIILNTKSNRIKTNVTYRRLNVFDTAIISTETGNSLTGNLEYSVNFYKGAVSGSSFIEHASGNEIYSEYTYLKVNKGQGYYTWIDFNDNEISELNEFVKANFSDEADYIKISLPSNKLQSVFNQSFNQTIYLIPRRIWYSDTGIKKALSLFSEQFFYKTDRKISEKSDYYKLKIPAALLLSESVNLKNNLIFELPKYNLKLSYIYSNTKIGILLVNGNDKRNNAYHEISVIKKHSKTSFLNTFTSGIKQFQSEFFPETDFSINYTGNKTSFTYKTNVNNDFIVEFTAKKKSNTLGEEILSLYDIGAEYKRNSINQFNYSLKFNYINITFEGSNNTSVSYEMTEGLSEGKNYLWSVLWYKKITEFFQLELNYSGRKTGNSKIIHTGSINIRAIF